MVEPVVRIENLCHEYPPVKVRRSTRRGRGRQGEASCGENRRARALDNVALDIRAGEIFGILGPNGGGKTTLFRVLSTLLRPTSGRVDVFGHCVASQPASVRRQLGVVFQMPSLDGKLTAWENLSHQGRLYGLSGEELNQRIDRWLTFVGLAQKPDTPVEQFSGGMRRRVELAKALLHDPALLLLDEPSTGLDVMGRRDFWQHLLDLRGQRGATVALTTHLMDEADRCDRVAMIHEGRLLVVDTPANLKARIGGDVITVEPADGQSASLSEAIAARFGPWSQGARPVAVDGRVVMERRDGAAFVAKIAGAFAGQIRRITVGQPTLEDVFVQLAGAAF